MDKLYRDTLFQLEQNGIVPNQESLLVMVSGGRDSMLLLLFLNKYFKDSFKNFAVLNINYALRGDESYNEQGFVKKYCLENKIKCFSFLEPINGKNQIQNRAREIRFKNIKKLSLEYEYSVVASGHHADDVCENLFIKLDYSSGPSALSGFGFCKTFVSLPMVQFIRPLLKLSRNEINEFIKKYKIVYCDDSSNFKSDYKRNYFRNNIINKIENKYPGFSQRVSSSLSFIRGQVDLLQDLLVKAEVITKEKNLVLIRHKFFSMSFEQKKTIVRLLLDLHFPERRYSAVHLEEIVKKIENGVSKILFSYNDGDVVFNNNILYWQSSDAPFFDFKLLLDSPVNDLTLSTVDDSNVSHDDNFRFYFSFPVALDGVIIRSKKDGDRIALYKNCKGKKIKKLFIDNKIPYFLRKRSLIITSFGGDIIGVIIRTLGYEHFLHKFSIVKSSLKFTADAYYYENNNNKYCLSLK